MLIGSRPINPNLRDCGENGKHSRPLLQLAIIVWNVGVVVTFRFPSPKSTVRFGYILNFLLEKLYKALQVIWSLTPSWHG